MLPQLPPQRHDLGTVVEHTTHTAYRLQLRPHRDATGRHTIYLSQENGIGFLVFFDKKTSLAFSGMQVNPPYRGNGFSHVLLEALTQIAEVNGATLSATPQRKPLTSYILQKWDLCHSAPVRETQLLSSDATTAACSSPLPHVAMLSISPHHAFTAHQASTLLSLKQTPGWKALSSTRPIT
jgi:GNAT superfamily N-acetyltransferase